MAEFWQYASLSSHADSPGSWDVPDQACFVPEGFSSIDSVSRANGLFARAYLEAGTGKVIVAVHGTNFNEIEDLKTDAALALGIDTSGLVPTQVTDLADFVADLIVQHGKDNVEITGHSLGGGLAALISAIFDIIGCGFDPAPFAEHLSGTDLARFGVKLVVDRLKSIFPDDFDMILFELVGALGDWVLDNQKPKADEVTDTNRLITNFVTAQMAGDVIDGANFVTGFLKTPFPTANRTIYRVDDTLLDSLSDTPIDLNSIDLLALAIKTSTPARNGAGGEWSARPLDGSRPGDGLIRCNADISRIILSGFLRNKPSLPRDEDGGWTALLRWWASDIEFYSRNYDAMEELMQKSAAADGFSIDYATENSLHGYFECCDTTSPHAEGAPLSHPVEPLATQSYIHFRNL